MSAAGRPSGDAPAASDLAALLREAGLVRLVAVPDGDALAALGLLGRACTTADVPFQASVVPAPEPPERTTDADATVAIGRAGGDVDLRDSPASPTAYEAARELAEGTKGDATPDPLLALAGVRAAGEAPGAYADLLAAAGDRGLDRRFGVAVPTTDLVDGLAHTTLAHTTLAGDTEAASSALADRNLPTDTDEADESAHRRVASVLSLLAVADAPPRAAEAVERALHPYVVTESGAPFATLGGYGDVLESCARERPGTAVALALGHDVRGAALDAWRTHATAAHTALRTATTTRHSGVMVYHAESAHVRTVARLAHGFDSPEVTTLVVTDGEVAAAGEADVTAPLRLAADEAGGAAAGAGDGTTAYGTHADADALVAAFREAGAGT